MINVLVVDDEAFLRKSIRSTIEQTDSRFRVIGEAGDGLMAMELIEQLKPDVVFVDMRMPILDGIGLLKEINNSTLSPLCIVLSGYSDFEYARGALHYHAFDYLLKPIDSELLLVLLNRIYDKVVTDSYMHRRTLFENAIYSKSNRIPKEEVSKILGSIVCFQAFYVCFGSYLPNTYRHLPPLFEKKDEADILHKINALCSKSEQAWCYHGNHFADYLIVVASEEQETDTERIPAKLFEMLKHELPPITIVYGESCYTLKELQDSIIDMKYSHILHSVFALPSVQKCNIEAVCSAEEMGETPEFHRVLAESLNKKNWDAFYKQVSFLLASCENRQCPQSVLLDILKKICEIANQNVKSRVFEEQVEELFYSSMNYPELKKSFMRLLDDILKPQPIEPVATVIEEIHAYIDAHFADILTLKSLSEKFLLSTSYLCSLFKKEYDISPIEYIIEKRINTSRILLIQDASVTIKEVAEKVGYSDAYYFSRLFKTYTGKTPSQYREAYKETPSG